MYSCLQCNLWMVSPLSLCPFGLQYMGKRCFGKCYRGCYISLPMWYGKQWGSHSTLSWTISFWRFSRVWKADSSN